jgi:sporulation protein YlmC with PRC-barrel domain
MQFMDVPLNVEVHCSDGACGRSTAIIVLRATQQVTHFVVQDDERIEYLVPIGAIVESSPVRISLRWSREELGRAEPFVREVPLSDEQMAIMSAAMTQSAVMGPYTAPDPAYMVSYMPNATMPEEQVQENEVAVHWNDRVEATDGSAGRVDELFIDPETKRISHLVLRTGHLWGKRDIFVPLDAVDHVVHDVIYLKLDKKAIEQLPAVIAPRK